MTQRMKTVLGCIRRADEDFSMIEPGDRVGVGVSGGKDSLLLLYALALYRKFCKVPYTLDAITLDMGLRPFDVSGIERLCRELDVPYTVVPTQIAQVIFDIRKEKNPCALCAKMRRGYLYPDRNLRRYRHGCYARGCYCGHRRHPL